MADIQALKAVIDDLSSEELDEIYNHLMQRRQAGYWLVPSENLEQILEIIRPVHEAAAQMTEQEIDDLIDEALDAVRRERKAHTN